MEISLKDTRIFFFFFEIFPRYTPKITDQFHGVNYETAKRDLQCRPGLPSQASIIPVDNKICLPQGGRALSPENFPSRPMRKKPLKNPF